MDSRGVCGSAVFAGGRKAPVCAAFCGFGAASAAIGIGPTFVPLVGGRRTGGAREFPVAHVPAGALAEVDAASSWGVSVTGTFAVAAGVLAATTSVRSSKLAARQIGGRQIVSCRAAAPSAQAPAVAMEAPPDDSTSLSSLPEHNVINEHGFVLPDVPDGVQASAFLIYDANRKPQYIGFSKDLRNTLRTLLCRRPELCYHYKCTHIFSSDTAKLLELRTAWSKELGTLPPGNKEPRQKVLWESPVDGGAMSARAYKMVAEQKAKQILRQLRDRDLKETIEWKEELILEGKVDPMPSKLDTDSVKEQIAALANNTRRCQYEVRGKQVAFEIFYQSEFTTNGGHWFDVEVSAYKQKSTHRVIVGNDFACDAGPRKVVEAAFATLLARKVARKTEGLITSEVFPINYFTVTNVAVHFPELLELLGRKPDDFEPDAAQWNFKQVHDYAQDDKRTIPAGPMGGFFDPAALQ